MHKVLSMQLFIQKSGLCLDSSLDRCLRFKDEKSSTGKQVVDYDENAG